MPHQNIVFHGLLKHIPWTVLDRLVEEHHADPDPRGLKTRAHLIAMLYGQLCSARGLREIETNLRSHASKLIISEAAPFRSRRSRRLMLRVPSKCLPACCRR